MDDGEGDGDGSGVCARDMAEIARKAITKNPPDKNRYFLLLGSIYPLGTLSEEEPARVGAVNGRMANRALLLSHLGLVMPTGNLRRKLFGDACVAFEAKLPHLRPLQQFRIGRAVRSVAGGAAFQFQRTVFENERALLVGVAFNTCCIRADGQFGLFGLKSSVRIMAIAASHGSFQHFVVERFGELRFRLVVTAHAELRLARSEHDVRRLVRSLFTYVAYHLGRIQPLVSRVGAVGRVAIGAADVISPMIAATEIIVTLAAGVTCQTRFRDSLRIHGLEDLYL